MQTEPNVQAAVQIRIRPAILQYFRKRAYLCDLLTLLAAGLAGRVAIDRTTSPFGVAFLAAATMAGCNAHFSLLGAMLGAVLLQGRLQMQAAAACALYYALHLLWKRFRPRAERLERLYLLIVTQIVLLPAFSTGSLDAVVHGLIGAGACIFGALVMQNALRTIRALKNRHVLTDVEQICLSAFFGVLLLGTVDLSGYGFSLPVILLLLFALLSALARGIAGVAVSVALASVLTIGGHFPLSFVGGIAACTLAGAALRKLDALGVLGGFVGCSLLVGTYVYTASQTINLPNLAVAGALFLIIPGGKLLSVCAYLDADKNRERVVQKTVRRIRVRTQGELKKTASVCREISALFRPAETVPEPPDALMQWTAQAAAGVCADCSLRILCWRNGRAAAETVVNMLAQHERGDRIRIRRPFDPSCKHMPQMAAAAWRAKNQYLVQKAMQQQTGEQYAFIHKQLMSVADVLDALARRVEQDRWIDEELETYVARGLERRGVRVFGADATYPDGRLQLHVRVALGYLKEAQAVAEATGLVLRRPMRLINTHTDGRQCILILEEAQQLTALAGTASLPLSGEGVSGDSTGEQRLSKGRVLFALSDGMGSGEAARLESESAIRMLFDLYGVGLERDVALPCVNKLLLKRKSDMYATLDAVHVDLATGDSEFIKYGAPPTFIYRGERLHTVSAEAPPAGIVPDAVPAVSRATLKKDDAVILFSDGALDALGERTGEAITESLGKAATSEEAAKLLLERALAAGQEDDMTVMVIKIA